MSKLFDIEKKDALKGVKYYKISSIITTTKHPIQAT